jgi:hypothetical protein
MPTSKVSIRFTSLTNLWSFRLEIQANIFELNMSEMIITCQCSEEHIRLAKEKYNGKLVEHVKEETANPQKA